MFIIFAIMKKNYFTVKELSYSQTAEKNKINNTPPDEVVFRLKRLIEFLNPLREAWGSAITVSSGYRCPKLNAIVGGVSNSQHVLGNAVDLLPTNGRMSDFKRFMVSYLKDKKYDQCIMERSGSSEWVHFGLYKEDIQQRNQIFELNV